MGYHDASPGGLASTGMPAETGGDSISPSNPDDPDSESFAQGQRNGQEWDVKSGGHTVIVTSPKLDAEAWCDEGVEGYVEVTYQSDITPVTTGLDGVTNDNNVLKVLTGQQVMTSLYGVVGTVNDYQWSVSGDVFKDWLHGSTGGEVYFVDNDFVQSHFYFFTKDADTVSVSCSANITLPDGKAATVTATSQDLTSLKPTSSWEVLSAGVHFNGTMETSDVSNPSSFGAFDPSSGRDGQTWNAQVTVPAPFSGGIACYCQTVKPVRYWYLNQPYLLQPGTYIYRLTSEQNGLWGLDDQFPYLGYLESDLTNIKKSDAPSQGIGNGFSRAIASGSFYTWLMFQPLPIDPDDSEDTRQHTCFVPLQKYSWEWSGEADQAFNSAANQWTGAWTLINTFGASPSNYPLITDEFASWLTVHPTGTTAVPDTSYAP